MKYFYIILFSVVFITSGCQIKDEASGVKNKKTGEELDPMKVSANIGPNPVNDIPKKEKQLIREFRKIFENLELSYTELSEETEILTGNYISIPEPGAVIYSEFVEVDACTGDSLFFNIYDNRMILSEFTLQSNYFFYDDFVPLENQLSPGLTKEKVRELLGTPAYEDESVMLYAAEDPVANYDPEPGAVYYFYPVRLLFEEGKLKAVWYYQYYLC